jgi:hypothetical protein
VPHPSRSHLPSPPVPAFIPPERSDPHEKVHWEVADTPRHFLSLIGMIDPTTLHVLLVIFFATLIRSTFGFGEGLIAVPLLAFSLPVETAAPVVVLLSITIAAVVVLQDWRKIHLRSTGWLLAPTLGGIPLGIALLTSIHRNLVKALLAILTLPPVCSDRPSSENRISSQSGAG